MAGNLPPDTTKQAIAIEDGEPKTPRHTNSMAIEENWAPVPDSAMTHECGKSEDDTYKMRPRQCEACTGLAYPNANWKWEKDHGGWTDETQGPNFFCAKCWGHIAEQAGTGWVQRNHFWRGSWQYRQTLWAWDNASLASQ